jgi:hypothetical protein
MDDRRIRPQHERIAAKAERLAAQDGGGRDHAVNRFNSRTM